MLVSCWPRRVCSEINESLNVATASFCVENMSARFDEVIVNMLLASDTATPIESLANEFVFEYEKSCDGVLVLLAAES